MLAIDFGLKRIGLAWYYNGIALPLEAVANTQDTPKILQNIIKQKNIKKLLIGLVKDEIRNELDTLISELGFSGEVVFIDEDLSSKEAEGYIAGRTNSKKLRKNGTLDSLAAMVILERYINLT